MIAGCGDNLTREGEPVPDDLPGNAIAPFPELSCPGGPGCADGSSGDLRVGAARVSITPDLTAHETEWTDEDGNNHYDPGEPFVDTNGNGVFDAVWLAGFGNGRPATGVNDAIWARAIVLERGDTRVALAVIDTIGWFANDVDATRARIDPGLAIDHAVIASTHVHEAPDTVGLWGRRELETGLDPDYQARVQQAIADAIADAVAGMEPVTMTVAAALSVDESGSAEPYVSDTRDPVILDPTLTVIRFAATDDPARTVASVVHWAGHPEYSGSRNNLITADYIYMLREVIENGAAENPARGLPALDGIGGEVVFVNGAVGGQVGPGRARPIGADGEPIGSSGIAKAEAAGTGLGRLALEAITSAELAVDVADPALAVRTGRMLLTVENVYYHVGGLTGVFDRPFFDYDEGALIGPGNYPSIESRVSYLQLGNVGIVSSPGELFPELFVGGYDGSRSYGYEFIDPDNENPPVVANAPGAPYLRDLVLANPGVEHALLAGMTEDFVGYVPPSYDYVLDPNSPYLLEAPGDHYEETNSVGPGAESEIAGVMRALIVVGK